MARSTSVRPRTSLHAAFLSGALLLPALMTAQLDRSHPPVSGPAPDVHIGQHSISELPNGMHLIVVEDHKLPLVSVQVRFDITPVHQGDKAGYVDLFGELLTAGAGKRSKAEIDKSVDAIGATLYTSGDGLFASALKKNLEPLMAVVEDVVTKPTFPEEEVKSALLRAQSAVQQRREDPDGIAEAVGKLVTFGSGHPYGEMTTGRTLGRIDRSNLEAYHRRFFRPDNCYLVFVGDITEKEAKAFAKDHFGKWKKRDTPITKDEYGREVVEGLGFVVPMGKPSVPGKVRNVYVVNRPGAAQSVIRVSFPLPLQPRDLRAQQAQVMNTILGGGIFNARLMQNLREKNGYTYGCYSSLDVDRFNSSLVITTSVRTEVTKGAVAEILLEMERMRNEPVTKEELILAKRSMMGAFGRSLEDPRTVARFALNTRLNDLPADHYETYLKRLDAITAEQVQEAATAFLHPNEANILVVGDLDQVRYGLEPFSTNKEQPIIRLTEDGERWKEELKPVTDRTAEQVIETYIYTVGGRDAIAKLRDLQIVRKETGDGPQVDQTEWFAGERYRIQRKEGPSVIEEIIYNGERALITGDGGSGELTDAGLEMVQRQSRPVPEVGFEKLLSGSRILGSLTEGDREVYKLQLTLSSGNSLIQFYDKASGLKLREVESQYFDGRMNDRTMVFSDWRVVGGVQLPHRIQESGGIRGERVSEVSSVRINPEVPKGFFDVVIPEMPEETVPPEMLPPEYTPREKEED